MNAEYKAIEDKLAELNKVAAEVGYQIKWVIEPFVECDITQEGLDQMAAREELEWSTFMAEEMAREEADREEDDMPPGQIQWYMDRDKEYREKH